MLRKQRKTLGFHFFLQHPVYRHSSTVWAVGRMSPISSQQLSQWQIILLRDRGTCMWTRCPRLLHGSELVGSQTSGLHALVRHTTVTPPRHQSKPHTTRKLCSLSADSCISLTSKLKIDALLLLSREMLRCWDVSMPFCFWVRSSTTQTDGQMGKTHKTHNIACYDWWPPNNSLLLIQNLLMCTIDIVITLQMTTKWPTEAQKTSGWKLMYKKQSEWTDQNQYLIQEM